MLLRRKLLLINAAVALVAGLALWLAHGGTRTVGEEYAEVAEHLLPIGTSLHELRAATIGIVAASNEIGLLSSLAADGEVPGDEVAAVEEDEDEELRAYVAAFENALASYAYIVGRAQDHGHDAGYDARAFERQSNELLAAGAAFGALLGPRRAPAAALLAARTRLEAAEGDLLATVARAVGHNAHELAEGRQRVAAAIGQSRGLVEAAAAVTLILLLTAGWLVARTIVEPVRRLTEATARVAAGQAVALDPPRSRDEVGGLVAAFRQMADDLAGSRARAEHLAFHDALTGLPNRVLLAERLGQALAQARRGGAGGDAVAVLCLDLDRFKQVNDALGHPVGDGLLRDVAGRLRACVREEDTVARLGGDEFAVVQIGLGQPEGADALARRLIAALSEPYEIDGHHLAVGASVGIALAPADGEAAEDLLKKADIALYRAKAEGRGTLRFFEAGMDARLQARRLLELDLRRALILGEFELHYQPLVDLRSGVVTGFEALLRWRHPQQGMIPPGEFIPLAEEIGLIGPLGEWVLARACADAAGWPAAARVAVNLSPVQFRGDGLVAAVEAALAAAGLPAQRLELEITEGVLLQHGEATLATLRRLRALGVRIAMDDFGTGYSSLGYLRSFPFDKIKIDRSFVAELGSSPDCEAIVRAVAALGCSLGIATTVEGVETAEQLDRLRAEQCDEVQGYFLGRPMPSADAARLLARPPTSLLVPTGKRDIMAPA